ncbi:hypothetical protein HAX54_042046 [Datura stramonium]|uniref:Uncharacterized protein n=1 Tax=Datura stramonium TaxID=4076 RepID=A0ABS8SLY2_DATST|nr:hypothetical protein [Datura stramonium]
MPVLTDGRRSVQVKWDVITGDCSQSRSAHFNKVSGATEEQNSGGNHWYASDGATTDLAVRNGHQVERNSEAHPYNQAASLSTQQNTMNSNSKLMLPRTISVVAAQQ